jgi:metal-responsive CopG/Arc/MetJ family transcriptional regulator
MSRGTVKKRQSEMVALWIPKPLVQALDHGVRRLDSDRSKFIRAALREKIARDGVLLETSETNS